MLDVITSTATILSPQVNSAVNGLLSKTFEVAALLLVTGLLYGLKLGLSQIKNNMVRGFARRAVAFAGTRLSSLNSEEKRKMVATKIHKKFPRISEEDVEQFLEEAYVELKGGLDAAEK